MKIKAMIKIQDIMDIFPSGTIVHITDCESDAFDRVWYSIVDPWHPHLQTDIVGPSALEILNKSQRNLVNLRLHLLLYKLENECPS